MRKHRRRHVRELKVPITRPLLDQFAQEMRFGMMTARLGYFNETSFDRIAQCINVIRMALEIKPPKDESVLRVIDGGIRAMQETEIRYRKTSSWHMTEHEQASVLACVKQAEHALESLDVITLYNAMNQLKSRAAAEAAVKQAA